MKNKKMLIIIGIIIIIAGILVLGAGLWIRHVQNNILDVPIMEYEPDIKELQYYCGGSSIGDLYSLTLNENTISMESRPENGMNTEEKSYTVGAAVYGELERIVEQNDMKSWTNLPKSELLALDDSTTSLYIQFKDGSDVCISSGDELPEGGWTAVRQIVEVLESYME